MSADGPHASERNEVLMRVPGQLTCAIYLIACNL